MASKKQFPLSIVIGAVDKVTAPLLRVRQKLQRFMAPVKRLQKSINRFTNAAGFNVMGKAVKRVGKATWNLTKQVGKLGAKLGGLAAVAGGLAFKMVNDFAMIGDAAAKTGKAIGLTAEQVQEYEFIADRSGVSQGVLNSSLVAFSKRLGELKAGTGGLFTMLKKVNPELARQLATTEDTGEAMDLFLEYIGSVPEASKQAALAAAGFSRAGVKMVNVAKEGAEGIEALRKEAHKLGLVIDNDAAAASETFIDRMTNMKAALTGVRNIIGGALMPVLEELITRFTKFIVENRGAIEKWAKNFAASIPPFEDLKAAVMGFMDQLKPLLKLLGWINDTVGVVNAILITLGTIIGGQLVGAVWAMIPALKALGVALLTTPVGWFIAAVAAIAGAVYLIYKNWDGIVAFFTERFDRVKAAFKDGFLKGMIEIFKQFNPFALIIDSIDALVAKLTGVSLKKALSGLLDSLNPFSDDEESAPARPRAMTTGSGVLASGMRGNQQQAKVVVDFLNLPQGSRVTTDPRSDADLDLGMGYSMGVP